jgi:hypothetical protein
VTIMKVGPGSPKAPEPPGELVWMFAGADYQ